MAERPRAAARGLGRRLRAVDPGAAGLGAAALLLSLYVIAYPFALATYPPITDLPFHAAETSIFRHYFDPAYHFREQFSIHPLEVPYLSMYVIGASLAFVFPIATATKLMAIAMLSLVPAGLAVLAHGMKKSPLLGLAALALTWGTVTQWGFFNFMGATGLFAMSIGLALLVVDGPTRARRLALSAALLGVFFTHVYRFPFAVLGVFAAGGLVYPSTKRFFPLVLPVVPALCVFVGWLFLRPRGMGIPMGSLAFHPERVHEIPKHLFGAYLPFEQAPMTPEGALERKLARQILTVGIFVLTAATVLFLLDGRARDRSTSERLWGAGVTAIPLVFAAGLFGLYLTLPYEAGLWFYVYPREIVTVVLMLLAATPDLPKAAGQKAAFILFFALASVPMTRFVSARFREFEAVTGDFREIVRALPPAPKLFYLMYWLGDSAKRVPPFLHLPAWIQAEKGGALGFHFVEWNHSPIRYREGSRAVPPPLPARFEWTPQYFRVLEHGPFFDWFLVRHTIDPHELFDPDPSIRLALHRGTWWLYHRTRPIAD